MGKKEKQDNFEEKKDCCEEKKCACGDECKCPPECGCHSGEPCTCGDDCECHKEEHDGNCSCECGSADGEECDCDEYACEEEACDCHDESCGGHAHEHEHHHHEKRDLAEEYLAMAQRLQADFDNYRKRVAEQLDRERQEGIKSVVEVFLPCLDAFREAKKSVKDENALTGINMVEEKILNAFSSLKVEKIGAVGQKFDPHLHNVIAVLKDESKDDDIILEEYQSGWTMNGKVIRYSKVVVNKKS